MPPCRHLRRCLCRRTVPSASPSPAPYPAPPPPPAPYPLPPPPPTLYPPPPRRHLRYQRKISNRIAADCLASLEGVTVKILFL
ncbi:hypothetical protein GUJ93_ZPchr0015g6606 [Zizania palustris]|uniref:Uncharacterized protein n=1 Tax=Zizania palustris TaxID=103762 RepID=A0A8J5W704_ZIZPA|nr:hypothetical protein GUJ93_ZPchr0015g6606 [Zizania palustris]